MLDSLRELSPPGPGGITIVDVSARDGLQGMGTILSPGARADWIQRLFDAGVPQVEAGSFVHPRRVPQMVGAAEVYAALPGKEDRLWFLVPNPRGLEAAREAGVRQGVCVVSATESHSRSNLGRSIARVLDDLRTMAATAVHQGQHLRVAMSMAWNGPDKSIVAEKWVVELATLLREIGFEEITLCDTYGRATPGEVTERIRALRDVYPPDRIGLHLHDASGLAAAGAIAGVHEGVLRFDASLGGLGGCPFVAGSRGNLDLETLVRDVEDAGFTTGIDLETLTAARQTSLALLAGEQ